MSGDRESQTAIELVDPLVGSIFDKRFRVEERIAAGGFGAIYRARHVKSGHPIALKVLHPTLASDLGVLARFRREGTTLTSLRNPHTITAYEFGQVDKTLFIVMELLKGDTLYEHYSTHGPLEWKRVVHIAIQVCESLEEAHAQGIVHRDLKPTNIHLESQDGDDDYVKVLDFGIAKILRGSDLDSADITNVGQMIGTLDYMSPEQMVGGQVTGQTDIYTLGIVMYEMIAGTRPFPESATAGAALAAMLKTTPEPLYLRAPVPRSLDEIVMRCLERETSKRYRTVAELRTALKGVLSELSTTATVQLADPRIRPITSADDDETAITPPPERLLEMSAQTAKRPKMEIPEWDDADERAQTTTTRPPEGNELARPTTPAVPAALRTPIPARPSPRPLESRHISTPVPQVVVAPFSSRPRPLMPDHVDPHAATAVSRPSNPDLDAAPTLRVPNSQLPVPGTLPGHIPSTGPTPPPPALPPLNPNVAYVSTTVGHAPAPIPSPAASLHVPPQRHPTGQFELGKLAARDETIRRIVWIVVLVVGAGLGFIIAMRL